MRHFVLSGALFAAIPCFSAELLVACASDLAPAQTALAAAFERATGQRVRFVSGSSGTLARQIANGAPFDVFLSANRGYVEDLVREAAVRAGSVRIYGKGRLALWPQKSLEELRGAGIRQIAIPNPKHAPYGVAARQALEKAGLWKELESKIVYGENVRQALQYADSGNADAVLTSWTLLQGRGVLLNESLHQPIHQAGAITTATKHPQLAALFLRFLVEGEGVGVLAKFGLR
ncbi:MAG: molybdate ABC transporter substrate-binding protein [Bryobacterales bacterium]|nr:molybdate ABC transporter substrate-binding protein [Bryobacterales bacterium]